MRDIEAPNHLLYLFETGIKLALLDGETYSGEDWNGNPNGSTMNRTILKKKSDNTIPQHYKMVFQQQMKVG